MLIYVSRFAGIDDVDFTRYPDKAYQLDWIRHYLECRAEQNCRSATDVTDRDVEDFYVKANKFALVSLLFVSLSSLLLLFLLLLVQV